MEYNECVYFAQDGEAGNIKIGFSASVEERIKSLRTGSPFIRLLATMHGDRAKETELHDRFAAHRVAGEWFRPHEEIVTFVDNLKNTFSDNIRTEEYVYGMGHKLLCPWCKTDYLHHNTVQVNNRDVGEDGPGKRVEVVGKVFGGEKDAEFEVSVKNVREEDLDGRRNSLRVRFWCEQCPHEMWLCIVQHKGCTYIQWKKAK